MKIDTIQTSFTGGEFAPALFGRTDVAQYANACALVENFLVRPYGPLISCPGTEFINDCKYTTGTGIDTATILMLHMNGENGGTTFVDSSRYNQTAIGTNGATTVTNLKKFGISSLFSSDGNDQIKVLNSHTFDITPGGSQAIATVDCWASLSNVQNGNATICQNNTNWGLHLLATNGTGRLNYGIVSVFGTQNMTVTLGNLTNDVFYHFAVTWTGSTINFYMNGVSLATAGTINTDYMVTTSATDITSVFFVGNNNALSFMNGSHIDEFRFSRSLRWVAPFVPPTEEYADADNAATSRTYSSKARLIPFIFSRDDAYIIEVGEGYFRFYNNGAVVVSSGSTPLEITHNYTAGEIFDIQYAQINDVIYLSHKSHITQKLTRISANNWTLTDFPFVGGPFFTDNAIITGTSISLLTSATITPSVVSGSGCTLSASANIFTVSGSTSKGHKNTYWKIGATVTDGTTGLSVQGYVQINTVTNPSTATATVIKTLVSTAATTTWAQGSWSDVLGWPARTTFHQQRLFFARTNYQPQNVWGSKSFSYEDFAVDGGADDDAIDIQLASNESNEIKWLAPGKTLLAGTYGGEFAIDSGDGSPLTPANTNVSKETSWGSEAVVPKKIGNFFYYIQRFSRKIRELFFNFDIDSYKSVDKTIFSPHISDSGFTDMAYQQNPDSILWCVTSEGTLATMTREVDQEVQGWARQVTDGRFESVATIPSASEQHDEVWVVVNRTIYGNERRYIERFQSPIVPDRQDKCFYVHAGLEYDAFESTTETATASTISLSKTSGTACLVTCNTAYFSASDVGQRIRAIDSDGATIGELKIVGYTSSTIVVGDIKYDFDALAYAAGDWGLSVSTLSGLDHLENKDITALGDGGTDGAVKTVSGGSVTLNSDYFVVISGLPYTQKVKTLPQEAGSQRGTAQGKIQRINQVAFKVNRSFKGFKVGVSEDNLSKIVFRDPATLMGTTEPLFTGVIPNIFINGGYQYGSQILLSNDKPLPIELLSIMFSLDTNDK